jgi:hypothetical protein
MKSLVADLSSVAYQAAVVGDKHACVSVPAFSDSVKDAAALPNLSGCGVKVMSRISLAFLIVTSLALTVYFGSFAWRLSDDGDNDITGRISAGQSNGWRSPPAK